MGGSLDLTVRGLPFGTRVSAISVPGALFGFPLQTPEVAQGLCDHTLSRLAASGTDLPGADRLPHWVLVPTSRRRQATRAV